MNPACIFAFVSGFFATVRASWDGHGASWEGPEASWEGPEASWGYGNENKSEENGENAIGYRPLWDRCPLTAKLTV